MRIFLLLIFNLFYLTHSHRPKYQKVVSWIQSPRVTAWGNPGKKELCPRGSWVTAMNLKIESKVHLGDDTSLNGIKLSCSTLDGKIVGTITSKEGPWGTYRSNIECKRGFATGFQLRSEPSQGMGDDVAAVNLKLRCTDFNRKVYYASGEELTDWGKYTTEQVCPPNTAICGILTHVEDSQGVLGDDTALNNVDMACCKIPIFD